MKMPEKYIVVGFEAYAPEPFAKVIENNQIVADFHWYVGEAGYPLVDICYDTDIFNIYFDTKYVGRDYVQDMVNNILDFEEEAHGENKINILYL